VTSSVRIAGVLLVFSYLIVPALAGIMLGRSVSGKLVIGWAFGTLGQRDRQDSIGDVRSANRRDGRPRLV
jgi:hypothetical protein